MTIEAGGEKKDVKCDVVLVAAGRAPVVEEIGVKEAGIQLTDRGFIKIDQRMETTAERVQELRTISRDPVSLDLPVGRDGESVLGDLLEGDSAGSLLSPLMHDDLRHGTAGVLRMLPPHEEKVIRMRYGIGCEREHTLQEIAEVFGLTRERIRQIEVKAFQRLRSADNAPRLRPLLAIQ